MFLYHRLIKPYMFRRDAESAHHQTMALMQAGVAIPGVSSSLRGRFCLEDPHLEKSLMGLIFKNPVGLAAGFDKDGKYINLLPMLGFGFAEIGTVTPEPQIGNPKPRLFRLENDEALINRMGFNNEGVMAMARRLEKRESQEFIVAGNIGKNKDTPNAEAHKDYERCFMELRTLVDFFVINVSSPNTPGLRELQNKESLKKILGGVQGLNSDNIPVLLKIAPDITMFQLDDIIDVMQESGLNGIVSHNTTVQRTSLTTPAAKVEEIGAGGLSGKPLAAIFPNLTQEVKVRLSKEHVMISSGGIHDPASAVRKIKTGADLVEVYTGLIYQGPDFVQKILKELRHAGAVS